jgi:hypothetical protein
MYVFVCLAILIFNFLFIETHYHFSFTLSNALSCNVLFSHCTQPAVKKEKEKEKEKEKKKRGNRKGRIIKELLYVVEKFLSFFF